MFSASKITKYHTASEPSIKIANAIATLSKRHIFLLCLFILFWYFVQARATSMQARATSSFHYVTYRKPSDTCISCLFSSFLHLSKSKSHTYIFCLFITFLHFMTYISKSHTNYFWLFIDCFCS